MTEHRHEPPVYSEELVARLRARIAELEGEVKRLDLNGIHTCHDECQRLPCAQRREIDALKADNAKLREALGAARRFAVRAIEANVTGIDFDPASHPVVAKIDAALSQTDGGEHGQG